MCDAILIIILSDFVIELKSLASPSLNLKRIMAETTPKEPVLMIISTGADPSQVVL